MIEPSNSLMQCLFVLFLASVHAAVPSPKASAELICHTNHASECYPRIFQPTRQFQTIHDDQDLPPGLHVRMDLTTGVKEARLNVAESDEGELSSGLAIVEDPDLFESESAEADDSTKFGGDVPSQQSIRPSPHNVAENSVFFKSASQVKSHASADTDQLLTALDELEDLAHSYRWGLTLAKDADLSHQLFQLLLPSQHPQEVRSLAALVLGTAIRNNPEALGAALSHFYSDEWPEGPLEAVMLALRHEKDPTLLSRIVFLLSSLCQDENQLNQFLDARGMKTLHSVYELDSVNADDMYRVRTRVSHFLDDRLR
ncbi:MAG: hypothetical protein L6R41_003968 [Letrouitia leprolyta]|nr:MAG: hypothetical protein L6R41_003968 [Letrouitia leprolyta]